MFEIGNSLREARMRRRIEIAQAEQATKVRGKYLRALEDEQFELLPSETYVKGFLRTYAEYLGLDGQLYVDEYNSRFVVGQSHDPHPRRVERESRSRRLETAIVLVVLATIAMVTVVVIGAWTSSGGHVTTPPARPAARTPAQATVPPPAVALTAVRGP